MKKKRRKINPQKIFCFVSFIFILTCIFWYGGRFIYFYQSSKKIITAEANTIARTLKTQNHDKETFKQYNLDYYFYQDATNNYLIYSNLLWRIVKINEDNSIVLITDKEITNLAYGKKTNDYTESSILGWLNASTSENSGILEKNLNQVKDYLIKTKVCLDSIDDVNKVSCEKVNQDYYLGLLSVEDYIRTGGKKSFINNEGYNYLANKNDENKIWYINHEGNLDTSDGEDILGIKPTITLSPTLEIKSGVGTKEDPYIIEDTTTLFGSYVQLDEDIWRVYEVEDTLLKLVLHTTLKETEKNSSDGNNELEELKYIYSNKNYYHNDTVYGSLAYYLNHTFLNSLSYKNIIEENKYTNGYYGEDTDFTLENVFQNKIDTKVAIPSIGDVILSDETDGYFTSTGISKESSLVYLIKNTGTVTSKNVATKAVVVPCISIRKENLKVGTGTLKDPYRMEQ